MTTTSKKTLARCGTFRPAGNRRLPAAGLLLLPLVLPLLLTSCPYEMPILQNPNDPRSDAYGGPIGEEGPCGGIIFYDKGDYRDGWRYLEAAPADAEFTAAWGPAGTSGLDTDEELGVGGANTAAIVALLDGESDSAAARCVALSVGGEDDWYLPSRKELELLYFQRIHVGGFAEEAYWSSTVAGDGTAYARDFSERSEDARAVATELRVRPIRRFGAAGPFSVTYDGNGATSGSAPVDRTTYGESEIVILAAGDAMARTGHTFAGWNTGPDGTGSGYAAGSRYQMPGEDTTLYAVWMASVGSETVGTLAAVPGGVLTVAGEEVTITGFYMSVHEVTQQRYHAVMQANPSDFTGEETRPVESVSWYDALVYCNRLSVAEGRTPVYTIDGSTDPDDWGAVPRSGDATWDAATMDRTADGYRLPTEAEWEYAARGGSPGDATTYAGSDSADTVAWYAQNASNATHPVGEKAANGLGLYDMSGNVWEWTWDRSGDFPSGRIDPTGPATGSARVIRGGGWNSEAAHVGVATRSSYSPAGGFSYFGFRIVTRSAAGLGVVDDGGGTDPTPMTYTLTYDANGADGGTPPAAGEYEAGATVTLPGAGTLTKSGYELAEWNTQPDRSGSTYPVGGTGGYRGEW